MATNKTYPTVEDHDDYAIIDFHRDGIPKIKIDSDEYFDLYEKMGRIIEDDDKEDDGTIKFKSPIGILILTEYAFVLFCGLTWILRWFNF